MPLPDPHSVEGVLATFHDDLHASKSNQEAQAVRDRYLGRKASVIAEWMERLAAAPPAEKRELGQRTNALKQELEKRWTAYLEARQASARPAHAIDVTLPGRESPFGHRHPLTLVRERMEEIFTRMGFTTVEGPEVEDEWHCFD